MNKLSPSAILNSWKEIAVYLGRGVRTVQRWEEELGLPVQRIRETNRSPVFAFESDLQKWLQHRGQAGTPQAPSLQSREFRSSSSGTQQRKNACQRAKAAVHRSHLLVAAMTQLLAEQTVATRVLKQNLETTMVAVRRHWNGAGEGQDIATIRTGAAPIAQVR